MDPNQFKRVMKGRAGHTVTVPTFPRGSAGRMTSNLKDFFNGEFLSTERYPPLGISAEILSKSFEELEALGEGGFGKVYKVRSKLSGHQYAKKEIMISISCKEDLTVIREVKIMETLKHKHIVSIINSWWQYEDPWVDSSNSDCSGQSDLSCSQLSEECSILDSSSGWSNGPKKLKGIPVSLCIQMELCDETLRHFLDNKGKCYDKFGSKFDTNVTIINWPQNVFLNENMEVKIGDFGLARPGVHLSEQGQDGVQSAAHCQSYTKDVGTLTYRAPEQSGSTYGNPVDMYSLGIILFELYNPFYTGSERAVVLPRLKEVDRGRIDELRKLEKRLPTIAGHIQSLLRHEPDKRPTAITLLIKMNIIKVLCSIRDIRKSR